MINMDHVISITEKGEDAYAFFTLINQESFKVNETYESVKKRLGVGGSPKK